MFRAIVTLIHLLFSSQVGIGTTFWGEGDAHNPDPHLACLHRDLRPNDHVVAHRTLPCGSRVFLFNPRTARYTIATVADRGPYGRSRGRYRAMVDLTPSVARKLRSNGYEPLILVPR